MGKILTSLRGRGRSPKRGGLVKSIHCRSSDGFDDAITEALKSLSGSESGVDLEVGPMITARKGSEVEYQANVTVIKSPE